jgi:hypothetical protein
MVSWLTRIMGSPGNSIRNLREICTGDHHSASQVVTWAASFGVLGRRSGSGHVQAVRSSGVAGASVLGRVAGRR